MKTKTKVEQIYDTYARLMFYIAFQILKKTVDAEDAVQQAFVSIIESLDKVGDVDSPSTKCYIATIVKHKAIDIIRDKHKYELTGGNNIGRGRIHPERRGVVEAISQLKPRYRDVLLLRYEYGYDTEEIARFYSMRRDSVQKLLWRAKEKLKEKLAEV